MRIAKETLKEYIEANIIKEYDISAKLREKHDEEVKIKRDRRNS